MINHLSSLSDLPFQFRGDYFSGKINLFLKVLEIIILRANYIDFMGDWEFLISFV